ncbi:MAG: hypothetical protein CL487_02250 [Acidobacteria bacterium]|jgi:hypothetical protein|uniref:Uncharacterized protein n=1 Tax=marine metagenome TaxID=408172 RepID=A0A381N3J1_9ZZZZ|nr:hypothetical protein [Acidobacteriota bacterium]MDP7211436.1 hypothetical protein [Vicinamibacterales bacterium]HJO17836.1 hypothetical protein [Vicinamibacterales bacterium]|tara:strand:+ start:360 stop:665 length:306 start_codon:yes stop_codon:yes gene_type:complete
MEDVVNRLARELADVIAEAVAENPKVEECREKSRAAGYEMRVSLEAVIGFVNRSNLTALAKVGTTQNVTSSQEMEISANDRRFLRSLRIAVDETPENTEVE